LYVEGAESKDCGFGKICCQDIDYGNKPIKEPAGKYGSYNPCGSAPAAVKSALSHISEAEKNNVDMIFLTGDFSPHDGWRHSPQSKIDVFNEGTNLVKSFFTDVPLFGVLGNHESWPSYV
jgi:hypothetical protein